MERAELEPRAEPLLVMRRSGTATPFNAHDAMAAVLEMYPAPVAPRIRGQLARTAKELLAAGFEPNVVCAAMSEGLRRARPGLVDRFAQEIVNAKAGIRPTGWEEWRRSLDKLAADNNPELAGIRNALRGAFKRR